MTRPTGQPVGVGNPELVARKESALLAVIADRPGLRACEICAAIEEPASATISRLQRFKDRDEIERTAHRWFIAGTASDDANALDLSLDDERMLSAMRVIPGGSSAEIAALVGVSRSSVLGRVRRLARLGVVTKGPGGYWRLAERERQSDDEDVSEFETPERQALSLVFDRARWIWPIGFYVDRVFNPSPFACRRYG